MQSNSRDLIQEIKKKANIEDVIGDYVDLQKKGQNFVGLCPFHEDKNPSMVVSPSKGIYKCFACDAAGDMFEFIKNYRGLDFVETLKLLSEKYDINWRNYITTKKIVVDERAKKIWNLNKEAENFFSYNLEISKDPKVLSFLRNRKLSKVDIKKFGISFSGNSSEVIEFLKNKKFEDRDIVQSGIGRVKDGKLVGYFHRRVLFTIKDDEGNIIGFSGRDLNPGSLYAKYLNTPETYVFKKGNFLYNYDKAHSQIGIKKQAIIVEGFMDVIAFNKLNYENVVATMGTSFTKSHIDLLRKKTKDVVLSFDNDEAGHNAIFNSGRTLLNNGFDVSVILNEKFKDIDEIIQKSPSGQEAKKTLIFLLKEKISFLEFTIWLTSKRHPQKPNYDNIDLLLKIAGSLNNEIERDWYLSKIANIYKLDVFAIKSRFFNINNQKPKATEEIIERKLVNKSPDKVPPRKKLSNNTTLNNLLKVIFQKEVEALSYVFWDLKAYEHMLEKHYDWITKEAKEIDAIFMECFRKKYDLRLTTEKLQSVSLNDLILKIFKQTHLFTIEERKEHVNHIISDLFDIKKQYDLDFLKRKISEEEDDKKRQEHLKLLISVT